MTKYFINRNNSKSGPFTLDQLKELKIKKTDLVFKEGTDDWGVATDFEELNQLIEIDLPPTPFEKETKKIKSALISYFYLPIIFGCLLGLLSLILWSNTKNKIYNSAENRKVYNEAPTVNYGTTNYLRFVEGQNKYAKGIYGFNPYQSICDNEEMYFQNTNTQGDYFRPLKSVLINFSPNTQFYVGKNESAPVISFLLKSISYFLIIYFLVFGIRYLIKRF